MAVDLIAAGGRAGGYVLKQAVNFGQEMAALIFERNDRPGDQS